MSNPPEPEAVPTVSAVVLAYKAEPWLRRAVESLLASEKVVADVVLVDNGCTTDDVSVLDQLPGVTVVRPGENTGFAGGCNLGAKHATGEYLALVNGDAVVEPTTLARLIEEASKPDVGLAVASVRLAEDPTLINAGANPIHVLGLSWSGRMGQPETLTEPVETAGASGACVVVPKAHWDALEGFDEEYFAYHEDAELSIRTWRQGLRVLYVPDAVAVHRYEFSRNDFKMYMVERNRLMFVATIWPGRALVLLALPLAGLEAAMTLMAAAQGWLPAKARGWKWLWQHRDHIRSRRKALKAEAKVPDAEWMARLTTKVDATVIPVPALAGTINTVVTIWWRMAGRWV
jgi:GT2 family glycosyltransferase